MNSNETNVGRNSSVVWIIYMSRCLTSSFLKNDFSLIFGGIFLLIVFGNEEDTTSKMDISMQTTRICYGAFTGVSLVGNFVFALLPPAVKEVKEKEEKDYRKELSM